MFGLAGAKYTPGMPHLDAYDAKQRHAEHEARAAAKAHKQPKAHVRNKAQRRDKGHITNG